MISGCSADAVDIQKHLLGADMRWLMPRRWALQKDFGEISDGRWTFLALEKFNLSPITKKNAQWDTSSGHFLELITSVLKCVCQFF